jgi:deoxyhypusine synthase
LVENWKGDNMRTIIRGIINNEKIPLKDIGLLDKKINRVYTILNEEEMYAKFDPKTGEPCEKSLDNLVLQHWKTVFFEDQIHDWTISGDIFKFHAHSSDIGDSVDLLIEFE